MAGDFAARTGLVVRTEIENLPADSSPELAHTLYRVAQEALANVSRHARASSVNLTLGTIGNSVELRIADDGVGFDGSPSSDCRGRGISNMQVRLAEVGGALTISKGDPGAVVSAFVEMSAARAD
jgi:two-component system NarL family sensor kinase